MASSSTTGTVVFNGIVITNPAHPGKAPPFMSRADNFKREMCIEEIINLWGPICLYKNSAKSLKSVKESLAPYWNDINDSQLIYDRPEQTSVYRVKHKRKDKECIIKVYQLPLYGDRNQEAHIIETYNLMYQTNLGFPLKICYDQLCIYVVMEPLQYTLKEYIEEKREEIMNEFQCKSIVIDILDNLWTLHVAGCIHGDIKPSNIMFRNMPKNKNYSEEFNGWKLIDFDNRIFIGIETHKYLMDVCGTYDWIPPEVNPLKSNALFKGKKFKGNYFCYGYDIWQIGLIILYILFGTNPYSLNEKESKKWNSAKYWYNQKVLRGGKYDMDSDKNKGEIWLRNYLLELYVNDKISKELFDLLHNHMLIFDPRKRSNCKIIYNHVWFDEVRE